MSNKGQVLIGLTTLMLIALMIYFLVAASQEISTAGRTDKIGEYQIKIANGIYNQKEGENYFYLSSKNAMLLSLFDFYTASHEKNCDNFVDPIFNNCKVDYEQYLKKEFENSTKLYLRKHDYVNNINFESKIEYYKDTKTIETEVVTGDSIISITTNDQGFCNSYLTQYHSYSSSPNYEWKLTEEGLEVKNQQGNKVPFLEETCAGQVVDEYGSIITNAAIQQGVPEQLIVMVLCTEAKNILDPYSIDNIRCENSVNNKYTDQELAEMELLMPGLRDKYCCGNVDDWGATNCVEQTNSCQNEYNKVACSTGIGHVLPDTALKDLGFQEHVDELKNPEKEIPLLAKYIKNKNNLGLNFDPILTSAAYNAGSPRPSLSNPWHLNVTGNHLNRAAKHFNGAVKLLGSYCSEDQLLGDLIYQQSFKINNSYNPEIFQPIYDFVEEVLNHHGTEEAMEQLEYNIDNFNQGSYNITVENNPCETNEFIELFEEAHYCSESPHQNCECIIHQFYGQAVIDFIIMRDGENTTFKQENEELIINKNILGFEEVSHELIGTIDTRYVINNGLKEYYINNLGIRNGGLTHSLIEDTCIRDKTIQRLCAKLDTSIDILDNTITEIPFDIEYYAKPKPLENVQIEIHQDSFIISWNAPQNKAYKYYIYNSQEQITNSNLPIPIWEGIGEFTQFLENNKLFQENNIISINITGVPLPFTNVIQENTKGLKSSVS